MVSPWKKNWIFEKWSWVFMKTANGSKIAVECNWISKISQNVKNYVFFEKHRFVFRKNSWFFEIAKSSKLALQGHWKK